MRILGQLKTSSENFLAAGRNRVQSMQRDRRRKTLMAQLGGLCYAERSGERNGDAAVEIDRLVDELAQLDESGDTDAVDVADARSLEHV